jgi:hypothetical protein
MEEHVRLPLVPMEDGSAVRHRVLDAFREHLQAV